MNDKQVINNLQFQVSARESHIKELEDKIAVLKSKVSERNKQIKNLLEKIQMLEQRNIELVRQVEWAKTFSHSEEKGRGITSRRKAKSVIIKTPQSYSEMMKAQGRW